MADDGGNGKVGRGLTFSFLLHPSRISLSAMKSTARGGVIPAMGPEQLGELVDRYAAALVLYARQWCDCPEDVVQTAFLKLVRARTRPDNLLPWLYRVVRNGAIDASRAARRRHKYESAAAG